VQTQDLVEDEAGYELAAPADPTTGLTCYLHPGWKPNLRPASPRRDWMNAAPEQFAYRCLPLNIANAHGWELLSPCTFEACWLGGDGVDNVILRLPEGIPGHLAPVSLFGLGTITFHVPAIFRTDAGWNLWVGGSPNAPKDGIYPLTGVIETDWSPFTFTMNWKFTRPNHWVRFEEGEPICFLFPVQRRVLESIAPRIAPLEEGGELARQFHAWSRARDEFHVRMQKEQPRAPADRWQKHYYTGTDVEGRRHIDDHRSKLRLAPFAPAITPDRWTAPPAVRPPAAAAPLAPADDFALRKQNWLMGVIEAHHDLSPATAGLDRFEGMTREEFLDRFYAPGRPVVLGGEMADWPALGWTPERLKARVGSALIEFQGERGSDPEYELRKHAHQREAPFDQFIDRVSQPGAGNDAYITAFNSNRNRQALAPLHQDMGRLETYLDGRGDDPYGMMWIGPAGTFTPLHHDLTNNFIAQIVGRKQVIVAPPSETSRLYNHVHVFSQVGDLQAVDPERFPEVAQARLYEVVLEPGDVLFLPIGWWHQVRALDFSVTSTFTNFLWRNDWALTFPR
jgi:hypothetical protein